MRSHVHGTTRGDEAASRLLQALKHPTRRAILSALTREPASAQMLADALDLPLGNVSYHLRRVLLEECDAVEVVQVDQREGAAEKLFALKAGSILGVFSSPAIPGSVSSFAYLPIAVDEDGAREVHEAMEEFVGKVRSVAERCADGNPIDLHSLIVGAAGFELAPSTPPTSPSP